MHRWLIVGLGNPGINYASTRHNMGFRAVDWVAQNHGLIFSNSSLKGDLAKGKIGSKAVILLKPQTFMNHSGDSVDLVTKYYQIDRANILVLVDDKDLPFGKLRMRCKGGPGGHNGLKSIEQALQSKEYARLRMGVGAPMGMNVASYVLAPFTQEEQTHIPKVLERAGQAVGIWLDQGITSAMEFANRTIDTPSIGEQNERK